jgi:hypothetical protein
MLINFAKIAFERYSMGCPDTSQLSEVIRFNIFYAFAHTAKVLGFNDDWLNNEAISPFNQSEGAQFGQRHVFAVNLPHNLQPTALQRSVEHHPWIDFFPCPRMRDNFLRAVLEYGEDNVDEDELCRDIVEAGSRHGPNAAPLVIWGKPWELSGWEVTEPFQRKWGWLLEGCIELMESTNVWRKKRGLRELPFSY